MIKKERAQKIQGILEHHFPKPAIPLSHVNSFTFLVAVLLSAQCTDERVNKITPKLFELGDSPEKMSKLNVDDIERVIRPCGLSKNKAKNIKRLSEILVEEYNGVVPQSLEALETLPGVGHKTASVVMVQEFNTPAFPVDTHIHRLAKRWKLSSGKNVVQTEKDLKACFNKRDWGKLHLQIIYFGRAFCPARGHIVEKCPICSWV
ncbi:MAG: Endonuclease III [Chlamydiae bacterium]|nr:Endonuclease III [Chlamydiota bacterium]